MEITQQKLALIRQRQVPGAITEMQQQVPPPPESELSICTDSMDTGSIHDGDLWTLLVTSRNSNDTGKFCYVHKIILKDIHLRDNI